MSDELNYILPENWSENELERLIASGTKITYGVVQPGEQDPNGVPFIRGGDIYNGKIAIGKLRTISQAVSASYKRTLLQGGELLMSLVGYPGEVAIVPKVLAGANIARQAAYIKLGQSVDSKYVMYYLQSDLGKYFLFQKSTGSAQQVINLVDLKDVKVVLPPLPEQQKIAAILTSVDEVIENTQAQINKLKDLKTGMMQELLTRGVGVDGKPHTEFKDSPVGRIPKGWEVVKLSEIIGSMDGGVSVNGDNRLKTHKEIGVLKVSSVFKGSFIPHEHKVVIEEDLNRVKINPLKDRILFSRANTPSLVGESGYVERNYDDLYLPDKIWMIDVKDRLKVNVRWLSYILSSGKVRKLICDAATGTSSSMKNISKPNLLSIQVGMPMLEEQKAISDILNLISNKLTLSSTKLEHVKKLKKALMQDLLTGKVRVKVDTE